MSRFNPANRPSQPFNPSIITGAQSRIPNRTIIPSKTVDESVIGKLFLLCIEGKVSAIKDFILTNGITVNDMIDSTGESILHKILINSNLSNRDKIELFRFLKDKNLLKMSYNSQQLTPLHLAVKNQISEIVKILLEAGHDPNNLDVNNKSPLFYAISGNNIECPKPKQKELLKKTKFKTEKTDMFNLVRELTRIINEPSNTEIYDLMQHISNDTKILDEIFTKDINTIFERDNKKILDILSSTDVEDVKVNKVFNLVNETRMSIAKLLTKNKLENALKPLTFEPNSTDGWGPTNNPRNKIMKVNFDFGKTFTLDTTSKIKKVVEQLTKSVTDINSKFEFMQDIYITKIDTILERLSFQYQVFRHFNGLVDVGGVPQSSLPNFGASRPVTDNFILDVYTSPPTQFTARELFSNDEFDLATENITSYDSAGTPTVEIIRDRSKRLGDNSIRGLNLNLLIVDYEELSGANNRERNDLRRILNDINSNRTLDSALTSGGLGGMPLLPLSQINNGIYYTRKIKIIYNQVKNLIKEIKDINTTLNTLFNNNYMNIPYDVVLNNCLRLQILLLSLANYLPLLTTEFELLIPKNQNLEKFIKNTLPPIAINSTIVGMSGRTHNTEEYFKEFAFAIDDVRGEFDVTKIRQNINDAYTSISNNSSIINNVINLINDLCGYKYMTLYFNNFNTPVTKPNTELIDNIYVNPLNVLNVIPSKLDDLLKLFTNNIPEDKALLVQRYLGQIHINSYTSYFDNTKPAILPTIGYLLGVNTNMDNIIASIRPINIKLLYGKKSEDNTVLLDAPANLQGSYGVIAPVNKNKKEPVLPILGDNINEHIKLIKYYIIRAILTISKNFLTNKKNGVVIDPKYDDYATIIYNMNEKFRTTLNTQADDLSAIFIIIATSVDKLLNTNIENAILSGINRFAYKLNRNPLFNTILNLLKQVKTNDPKVILGTDTFNIEHFMKNSTFLIESLNDTVSRNISGSKDAYVYTYAENVFKTNDDTQNDKIIKNYSRSILDNTAPVCYSINYDIIDSLINHKANVSLKDKDGSTVIFTAIDMNNPELVKKFISLLPISNKQSSNIFGIRPIEHSRKQLLYFLTMFNDRNILKDLISTSKETMKKKSQVDLELRYTSELYYMIYVLLNHFLYFTGKQYINDWTLEKQKVLDSLLKMGSNEIPLLDLTVNRLVSNDKDSYLLSVVNNDMEQNKKIQDRITKINEQIANLNKEKADASTNKLRKQIIDSTILNLNAELAKPEYVSVIANNKTLSGTKTQINIEMKKPVTDIKSNFSKLNISTNLVNMYESIQSNIINNANMPFENDYKTYMIIWKDSIKNNDNQEISIIENIANYINVNNSKKDILEIDLCSEYLEKIIAKLSTDYNDLEYEFNGSNYVLNNIIEIIKHAMSHTMGVNLLNMIQQVIREEIKNKFPYDDKTYPTELKYNEIMDDNLKKTLLSSNDSSIKLDTYIMDTLIEKLIKINLGLYEDETDKENIGDVNMAFNVIIKLLESNAVVKLDDTSLVIKELKEKIFPYFRDYAETNIKLIKRFIDGYMSSLINLSNAVSIYSMALNKANLEK